MITNLRMELFEALDRDGDCFTSPGPGRQARSNHNKAMGHSGGTVQGLTLYWTRDLLVILSIHFYLFAEIAWVVGAV